jgi:hypothetical protein
VPKGWNVDVMTAQSIVEILSKAAGGLQFVKIPICGNNDPGIRALGNV